MITEVGTLALDTNKQDTEWVDMLCSLGSYEEFEKINNKAKCLALAIMEYRGILIDRGYNKVTLEELKDAYTNKNFNVLHILLEKLFLEPLSEQKFRYILEKIGGIDNGLERIYNRKQKNPNTRAMTTVLTF